MIPSKYQQAIFDWIREGSGHAVVEAVAGSGKCLGRGTPVLLANGEVVPVESIYAGMTLMGPDSQPRTVLSTCTGTGPLFKISPVKGASWVCNDVHVLTLKNSVSKEIFDIPLNEYLAAKATPGDFSRHLHNAKLFRVGISLQAKTLRFDPYMIGLWLGDGTMEGPNFSTIDQEIIDYLTEEAGRLGLSANIVRQPDKCPRVDLVGPNHIGFKNHLREHLKMLRKDGQKRISELYLRNGRDERLALLAGLIDSDGYLGTGFIEIITKWDGLRDDILYLARSLGFAAYASKKIGTIKATGFSGEYWRVGISGDLSVIPTKLARKQAEARLQKKDVLNTGFSAESIGDGEYFGFTLDGDGRFLLGDFTVTHNTTTVVKAMEFIPASQQVLFLAFNKSIATELGERIPRHCLAQTLNSLGHRAWMRNGGKVRLDADKTKAIMQTAMTEVEIKACGFQVRRLIGWAKSIGLVPADVRGAHGLIEDSQDAWEDLIDYHDLECFPAGREEVIRHARRVLTLCCEERQVIDFDDQLYLPVIFGVRPPTFDWVFVDEAQDLSPVQHRLVVMACREGGRIVAVGDSKQAIYGFRGAASDSMGKFRDYLGATTLPLSICYRCPAGHVRMAQKIVPEIEAAAGAPEGETLRLGTAWKPDNFTPEDLIICRASAPLVKAAYKLLAQKIAVRIMGRNIGQGIVSLIKKLRTNDLTELGDRAGEWKDREIGKLLAKDPEANTDKVDDKYETLMTFIEMFPDRTAQGLIREIEAIYDDTERRGVLTLATIHKAKGLEAHRVFVLNDWMLGRTTGRGGKELKPWQAAQERNLQYVAYTRAKSLLGFIDVEKRGKR